MKVSFQICRFSILATLITLAGFASVDGYAEPTQTAPVPTITPIPWKVQSVPVPIEATSKAPVEIPPEGQIKSSAPAIEGSTKQQPPSGLTSIERYFAGKVSPKVPPDIRLFGYDLFKKPPSTFSPASTVPVGPDYVVGPGDEIRITVWGKFEGKWNVIVDRDGLIALPHR